MPFTTSGRAGPESTVCMLNSHSHNALLYHTLALQKQWSDNGTLKVPHVNFDTEMQKAALVNQVLRQIFRGLEMFLLQPRWGFVSNPRGLSELRIQQRSTELPQKL